MLQSLLLSWICPTTKKENSPALRNNTKNLCRHVGCKKGKGGKERERKEKKNKLDGAILNKFWIIFILVTLYTTSVIYLYNLLICKGTKSQLESRTEVFRKMKYKYIPKHMKGSHPSHKINCKLRLCLNDISHLLDWQKILKFNTTPLSAEAVEK